MATINGSTNSSSWDFKLEVSETNPSAANNTSSVVVDVYIGRLNSASYMYGAQIPVTVKCTGMANKSFTYKNAGRVNFSAGQWLKIGSVTFTGVPHNSDGSKTVTVSASFTSNISPSSGSASGSFTLTTLARKSSLSVGNGTLGENLTLTINRADSSFTHTLSYKVYNTPMGNIVSKTTATEIKWPPPLSLASHNTAGTSVSVTFTLTTYSGSTAIGSVSKTVTLAIPASVKPTCKLTLEDITGIDDIYGSPVQNLSKIRITVTPTLAYGSPIEVYSLKADGVSYAAATATTNALVLAGDSLVSASVKDKRGRSGSVGYTMKVQAYTFPHVSKLEVHRCNADGSANDEGNYIKVVFSAAITSLNSKNSATYALKYKKTSATSWTTQNLTDLTSKYSVSNATYIIAAESNSSYDIEVTAKDNHKTDSRSTSVSTAFTLMNWGANGTSMGIGKVAEKARTLENALTLNQLGNRYALSTPGVAGSAGFVRMATIEVIAANADTPITFVFTSRQAVSPMTVYVSLRNSTAETVSVGSVTYEGSNYDAYLAPDDDLVWGLYVKKASNYDTITLQDWYTSDSMMSRVKITFPGSLVSQVPVPYYKAISAQMQNILDFIYPVDSVYISYSHKDPTQMFGGTWVRITNAFLWAVDDKGTIGQTGGEKTHTLTVDELPSHSHGSVYSANASGTKNHPWLASGGDRMAYGTVATGGGAAHNNMPPYVQVSVWRRTA